MYACAASRELAFWASRHERLAVALPHPNDGRTSSYDACASAMDTTPAPAAKVRIIADAMPRRVYLQTKLVTPKHSATEGSSI